MHDIKMIREDPTAFDEKLALRGAQPCADAVLLLDKQKREAIEARQKLQQERNEISKQIGGIKSDGGDATELMAQVASMKTEISRLDGEVSKLETDISSILAKLPNLPMSEVPAGADESCNLEVRTWGEKPKFDFEPKEHTELSGGFDFDTAAAMSGSRFSILKGKLAALERALGQYMIDYHVNHHGYEEVSVPLLVNRPAVHGTGQLPKFEDDLFRTTDGKYLIPTAEVPLTNTVADRIMEHGSLPVRMTALTPCFRSEAGASGRDVHGIMRQHQFNKCELVSVVAPEESEAELERMTACAEKILQLLGLHYRVVLLSTGDMGFAARKTYDLEVWLPGAGKYREISSCSLCGDFQARRMNARYRNADGKVGFLHTLNGSGVAVGRALIAVLENYQTADGGFRIPGSMMHYMRV